MSNEISDTPRTDAAEDHYFNNNGSTSNSPFIHARTLERELAASVLATAEFRKELGASQQTLGSMCARPSSSEWNDLKQQLASCQAARWELRVAAREIVDGYAGILLAVELMDDDLPLTIKAKHIKALKLTLASDE